MKKSIKLTSALLTAGLLISPLATLNNNFNNVAEAKTTQSTNNVRISQKDKAIGNIVKDYIKLNKVNNSYRFIFIKDSSLDRRLKKINANITSKDVQRLVNNLNSQLIKQGTKGQLYSFIDHVKNQPTSRSVCSNVLSWGGLGVGAGYGALGLVLGATGPAGWALWATGTVIGGVATYGASQC
ncbi:MULTISPECIES: hypothetical protein [unclassified Gemella]|uniref:hypothetical protein n=1 Tax=unclassified Gemella TaxID=2624949 RepID=UPI0015CFA57F|nr:MULTISPECIES: hypothetical protein [unclassified Gemella]MBF0710388.1 hypothetical protein [Gemella sp. GL1.1]NYS27732.1 hypothetical protein [Gemella sp. GL1]